MVAWTNAALGIATLIVSMAWNGAGYILAAETQTPSITTEEGPFELMLRSTMRDPAKVLVCGDGRTLFDRDGMWGIRNAEGNEVIAPRYRALDCFKDGMAWAAVDEQRQWCVLGPDGTLRDPPSCAQVYSPVYWTHTRQEELDKDPYESSVLWARARLEFAASKRDRPPRLVGDGGGRSF